MQLSHKLLNVLPKNPDNTRKNDYEKIRQNVFSRNKVRGGVKKSLAAPAAVKSSQECSRVCIWLCFLSFSPVADRHTDTGTLIYLPPSAFTLVAVQISCGGRSSIFSIFQLDQWSLHHSLLHRISCLWVSKPILLTTRTNCPWHFLPPISHQLTSKTHLRFID